MSDFILMRLRFVPVATLLLVVFTVTAVSVSARGLLPAGAQTPPAEETLSPEDRAARATFEMVCGACHEAAIATTTFRTPQEWTELLETMVSFGASASEAQFMEISRYLNRRYGKVNLNRATADDLALVLDVPASTVQAILERRSTTRFTSADDLAGIPGITPEKLASLRDRLQF